MVDSSFDDHDRYNSLCCNSLDAKTVNNVERSIRNFKKGKKRGKATRFHQALLVESKKELIEHHELIELEPGEAQQQQQIQQQQQQQQQKVERIAIGLASPGFQCLKREVKFSYPTNYLHRFCDLLKEIIEFPPPITNTNTTTNNTTIKSLEDWHKTIDGFSELKSCKSAKKILGRQLNKGVESANNKYIRRNDRSCDDDNTTTNSNNAAVDNNETAGTTTTTTTATTTTTTPNQKLQLLYEEFIREVIIPHLQEAIMESELELESEVLERDYFVQAKPCIRFQQPSNKRTTTPHCDSFYGHQPGQINFWLPLTRSFGSNSLYSESEPGKRDFHSFDCNLNLLLNNHQSSANNEGKRTTIDTGNNVTEMMRFYGNECVHFTEANRTEITRVSLDFRVVPGFVYDDDYVGSRHSKNGRQLFKAAPEGEYYKLFRV